MGFAGAVAGERLGRAAGLLRGRAWGSAGAVLRWPLGGVWISGWLRVSGGRTAGSWCGAVVGTVFCLWRVLVRFLGCAGGGPAAWGGELCGCSRARCGLAGGVLCAGVALGVSGSPVWGCPDRVGEVFLPSSAHGSPCTRC